jgi:two-component system, LuxR family, secretion system response regulator SsrB
LLGTSAGPLDDELTSREREILRLVLEGKKNAEIACILNRSVHTVRSHRAHLMRKLGIRSAADWVDAAERCGVTTCSAPAGGLR